MTTNPTIKKSGVKTDAGKLTVRENSFRHGLRASALIISKYHGETIEDYEELYRGLYESFEPRNRFEATLIDQMAKALFKMNRAEIIETGCFRDNMAFFDEDGKKLEFSDVTQFDLLHRYKTALENQYFRAFNALCTCRSPLQLDLFGKGALVP